jgi:hypothetical protein
MSRCLRRFDCTLIPSARQTAPWHPGRQALTGDGHDGPGNIEMAASGHRRPAGTLAGEQRRGFDVSIRLGVGTYGTLEDGVGVPWRTVDPVVGEATQGHMYEPGRFGPLEAGQLVASNGGWHDPHLIGANL